MKKLVLILGLVVAVLGLSYVNPNYVSPVVTVVKSCAPAVVKIEVVREETVSYFDPFTDQFFRKFFGDVPFQNYKRKVVGIGSGFIFDKSGYILTNEHVVHEAKQITVTMLDGSKYSAKYIGGDEELDIAVIKIDPKGKKLPVLEMGDSDKLEIGEWAIAIGNPLGFQHTVTVGVISALHRKIPKPDNSGYYTNLIQTDAAINPGNSGGPLLNIHGQVVGINTAIINPSEAVNIGFAIPINTAKRFIDSLIKTGKAEKAFLGVRVVTVTEDHVKALGLKVNSGALVTEVIKGSPADKSGIKVGDVIIRVNNQKVSNAAELVAIIHSYTPNDVVRVLVDRKGRKISLNVKLGKYEGESQEQVARTFMGITVDNIQPGDREQYSIPSNVKGVIVRKVASSAFGIQPGDVIERIVVNGKEYRISNVKDWNSVIKRIKKGDYIALYIVRQGGQLITAFPYMGG